MTQRNHMLLENPFMYPRISIVYPGNPYSTELAPVMQDNWIQMERDVQVFGLLIAKHVAH